MSSNKIDMKFTKGLFSILLVATLMTVFELSFYITLVAPTVKKDVKNLLGKFSNENLNLELTGLFDTFIYRENKIIIDVNTGSYIIIVVEILFLFAFLAYLYMRIQRETRKAYYITYLNRITSSNSNQIDQNPGTFKIKENFHFVPVDMYPTIVTVLITVIVLMCFQIIFFNFGRHFHYTGRHGLEEVEARIIQNLRKSNLLMT